MTTSPVTVVVGAGIWGLTCARSLLKSGRAGQILLLDSDDRAGGKLDTLPSSGFLDFVSVHPQSESILTTRNAKKRHH